MCHRLNVNPRVLTRRQKRRPLDPERAQALKDKVDKLIRAGFMREVKYLAWVSNLVMVPKLDGRWRCCVDFTNVNEAYPNDSFFMPRIDQMVDAISWERPYQITKVLRSGAYRLVDLTGVSIRHPRNAEHLKKYYQ